MKPTLAACLGLLVAAIAVPVLWAQVPVATTAVPVAVADPVAVVPVNNIYSSICLSPGQKLACRQCICNSPLGRMLCNIALPMSAFTGGLVTSCCPATAIATGMLLPADSAAGAAARIKKDEAEAKARRADVRYLGTVDCRRWPEAEDALINSLRVDRNECVRLEAAYVLGRGCCCTKRTIEALSITVAGSDRDNNPAENSERVKMTAVMSLQNCLACYVEVAPVVGKELEKILPPEKELPRPKELPNPGGASLSSAEYYKAVDKLTKAEVIQHGKQALAQATSQPHNTSAPRRGGVFEIIQHAFAPERPAAPTMVDRNVVPAVVQQPVPTPAPVQPAQFPASIGFSKPVQKQTTAVKTDVPAIKQVSAQETTPPALAPGAVAPPVLAPGAVAPPVLAPGAVAPPAPTVTPAIPPLPAPVTSTPPALPLAPVPPPLPVPSVSLKVPAQVAPVVPNWTDSSPVPAKPPEVKTTFKTPQAKPDQPVDPLLDPQSIRIVPDMPNSVPVPAVTSESKFGTFDPTKPNSATTTMPTPTTTTIVTTPAPKKWRPGILFATDKVETTPCTAPGLPENTHLIPTAQPAQSAPVQNVSPYAPAGQPITPAVSPKSALPNVVTSPYAPMNQTVQTTPTTTSAYTPSPAPTPSAPVTVMPKPAPTMPTMPTMSPAKVELGSAVPPANLGTPAPMVSPSLEVLLYRLREGTQVDERQRAATELTASQWKDRPEVRQALTTCARTDSSQAVRATCLGCLSRLNGQ